MTTTIYEKTTATMQEYNHWKGLAYFYAFSHSSMLERFTAKDFQHYVRKYMKLVKVSIETPTYYDSLTATYGGGHSCCRDERINRHLRSLVKEGLIERMRAGNRFIYWVK